MYSNIRKRSRTSSVKKVVEGDGLNGKLSSTSSVEALEALFSPPKSQIDESWIEAEVEGLEWESILPGKRYATLSGNEDVYGVRVSVTKAAKKVGFLRVVFTFDCSVVEKCWSLAISGYKIHVQSSKSNPYIFKFQKKNTSGFKLAKQGRCYKINFVSFIPEKGCPHTSHSRFVKFKKVGTDLIVFANELLDE